MTEATLSIKLTRKDSVFRRISWKCYLCSSATNRTQSGGPQEMTTSYQQTLKHEHLFSNLMLAAGTLAKVCSRSCIMSISLPFVISIFATCSLYLSTGINESASATFGILGFEYYLAISSHLSWINSPGIVASFSR